MVPIAHLSYRALEAAVEEVPVPNAQAMLVAAAVAVVVVIPAVLVVPRAALVYRDRVPQAAMVAAMAARPPEMEAVEEVAAESA
jgi:hypothetical protein